VADRILTQRELNRALLARSAARPRAADGRPAREVPGADLPDDDAAVGRHVPRRRVRRRHLGNEGGHVRFEAFERLDRATTREVRDEAERLAAFHA
jgi:hypothetical protein